MEFNAPSWNVNLKEILESDSFKELKVLIKKERLNYNVFPDEKNVFKAFESCSFEDVRVVILGQDPYPTAGHANGLAFSVKSNIKPLPKSLQNIFKEIEIEYGFNGIQKGDLTKWASQGVLLLNNVLTVREGSPYSHKGIGWEVFTNNVLNLLNDSKEGIVYMLWGKNAQKKGALIDESKNLVLKSVHPSPLSAYRGFFGCNHFKLANDYLLKMEKSPINWIDENNMESIQGTLEF
ncbi:MAG: uracil-DNA glycosylase [Crocinitomicaceae bacterium]